MAQFLKKGSFARHPFALYGTVARRVKLIGT
jgi:hypothetical protein